MKGQPVKVVNEFLSRNKDKVILAVGMQGVIKRINDKGSAYVKFDDHDKPQWVHQDNFKDLESLTGLIGVSSEEKTDSPDKKNSKRFEAGQKVYVLSSTRSSSGSDVYKEAMFVKSAKDGRKGTVRVYVGGKLTRKRDVTVTSERIRRHQSVEEMARKDEDVKKEARRQKQFKLKLEGIRKKISSAEAEEQRLIQHINTPRQKSAHYIEKLRDNLQQVRAQLEILRDKLQCTVPVEVDDYVMVNEDFVSNSKLRKHKISLKVGMKGYIRILDDEGDAYIQMFNIDGSAIGFTWVFNNNFRKLKKIVDQIDDVEETCFDHYRSTSILSRKG